MDTSKEVARYTVITGNGYWGKGMSILEAAKFANVTSKWVSASIYYANPQIIDGAIHCNGMGGTEWTWTQNMVDAFDAHPDMKSAVKDAVNVTPRGFRSKIRILKGVVIVQTELRQE